jgi:hypothetical protein
LRYDSKALSSHSRDRAAVAKGMMICVAECIIL